MPELPEKNGADRMSPDGPEATYSRKSDVSSNSTASSPHPEPSLSERGELALGFARRGWHVFPIKAKTKDQPRVKWGTAATKDTDTVAGWWRRWPRDNIGIACGPSGLLVLDLDMKKGKNGVLELQVLELEHGALPPTLSASTPTGGRHLYFSGEAATTTDKIARGVDTRGSGGKGGYVLAPGSETGDGAYAWTTDAPVAPLPGWLRSLAGSPRSENTDRATAPRAGFDNEADIEWARRMLRDTEAQKEGDGSDDQTYRLACLLRDRGISDETAILLMNSEWHHPHDPEWVAEKVRNAFAYAVGNAGGESAAGDFDDDTHAPETTVRSRLRPLSFSELKSLRAPRWRVHRLIPDGGLAVVYGRPKAGKTFWALDLSLSIATGRDFHGANVSRGRVTYIAAEGGPARLRDRIAAWLKAHGAAEQEINEHWELVAAPVDLADPRRVGELLGALRGPRALMVFDTLARCMSGDENSQKDMSAAVRGCDRIRAETGAAVMLVHHEGKDGSKGARGSTVLRGAIDTGIRGRNEGGRISFAVEDQRDDEPLPPTYFELAGVVLDGIEHSSAVLRPSSSGQRDDADALRVRDIAARLDGESKKSLVAEVVASLGGSDSTAHRRINAAIMTGRDAAIEHDGGLVWLEKVPNSGRGEKVVRFERPED